MDGLIGMGIRCEGKGEWNGNMVSFDGDRIECLRSPIWVLVRQLYSEYLKL